MCRPHANRSGPADVNLTYVRTRVSRATCERWLVQGQPRISPDCSGAATYVVLGADLSAMWETFHGDNRKRTATNAVAPITANTVVPSPRSGLELRSSCIISPNAPNVQTSSTRERSSGASATASGAKLPESRVSRVGAQILMGLANRCNQSVESRLRRNNRTSSILLHRPQRY